MELLSIRSIAVLTAFALPLAACSSDPLTRPINEAEAPLPATLDDAASEYDIPLEVLAAIADAESGFQDMDRHEEFEGRPVRVGMMGIPSEHLADAAALAGVTVDDAADTVPGNIAAAAALLDSFAGDIDRTDLGAWADAVAEYSALPEGDAAFYVHDEVYRRIATGIELEEMLTDPWTGELPIDLPQENLRNGGDRSYAVWRPSPNNSARPSGSAGNPSAVIIHTCEGAYTGCWSWLRNSRSGVSAHYVVNDNGSEITQLVRESRKAWHIGATYDCDLNDGVLCERNGASSNNFTIGIEHAGSASQSSFSAGMIDASTQLVCDITRTHNIPRDSYHIVGHGQLQPYNRVDPGRNWPWSQYLAEVRERCGDTASSGSGGGGGSTPSRAPEAPANETVVIDSNNGRNTPGRARIVVSSNWTSSANVRGYYNTGYWWRASGSSSDGARFEFLSDNGGCYAVDAWWASGSDRSAAAPFIAQDASGRELGRTTVDQRRNGGQWNTLGTYRFTQGWNGVTLSRRADSPGVVIADAVRVRPSSNCAATSEPEPEPTPTPDATPIDWTIDTDNRQNNSSVRVSYSGGWNASSATPGFYGSDYVWRQIGSSSDPLTFEFDLDSPKRLRVEARWTAGRNRSTAAPFIMFNASDREVGRSYVDQRSNHATWVTLGTYDFSPGTNSVALSHWTNAGTVVVADAIRVREVR